ncbi:MAG: hypothetical protein CHACPFDD_03780 [Phycisphaerae bacterium]|nr:hypothetical protein [Phycisphaerae bacterium]
MNCSNCGAAMRYLENRRRFVCDYCASVCRTDALSDGILPMAADVEQSCPVCDVRLAAGVMDGVEVRHCERCHGVLTSHDRFADIVRRRRQAFVGERPTAAPIDPRELEREVRCPSCQTRMETHPYYGPGNVVIDTCAGCGVVWLDGGELGSIERAAGSVWRK